MVSRKDSNKARLTRHKRVRAKISGTPERPRLCVYPSLEKDFENYGGNKDAAKLVGKKIAERALEKGIKDVVFDRGGYVYHGRVASLADGAREGGLAF